MLCGDSEHTELYSDEERQVLLWRLFELVCIGGACCQFEVRVYWVAERRAMLRPLGS